MALHDATVPPRIIEGDQEQWQRVASTIYERRLDLRLTHRQAAERSDGDVSVTLLSLLENARQQSYQDVKLRAASTALGWTPDSIERILRGEEPQSVELDEAPTMAERLAKLEADMAALKATLAGGEQQAG